MCFDSQQQFLLVIYLERKPELLDLRVINVNEASAHVDWEWYDIGDEYEKISHFIFYWGTGDQTSSGETQSKRIKGVCTYCVCGSVV